jgi:hypothetical protein
MHVPLSFVLTSLPGTDVHLQPRPARYLFGCRNYGEVASPWYNAADGDKWDVFAPGYARRLPTCTPYRVAYVLGFLDMENGNSKIAVRLANTPGYRADRARREIDRYVEEYTRRMRKRGVWRPMT